MHCFSYYNLERSGGRPAELLLVNSVVWGADPQEGGGLDRAWTRFWQVSPKQKRTTHHKRSIQEHELMLDTDQQIVYDAGH